MDFDTEAPRRQIKEERRYEFLYLKREERKMGSATKSDRDSMSLVLDQMSEMQKMLRSVMEQVRNLEDKVEGLQKENVKMNKHLKSQSPAREGKQQKQQPDHRNTDGEVDDVKTLVMRRAVENASNGTTVTPSAVPLPQYQPSLVKQMPPLPTIMPTQQTTSTLVPKIAKKKERTFATNDPRREAYLARARKQAVANGVVVDTLADSSEEKKRQLKKKVGDEQQERATKKAKVRDNGNNGGTSLVNQKKAAKKEKKKKKDEGMEKLSEQEKHHLKYGHGRRGVRVDTVQGPAYFSLNNEQLLEIGDKMNVHPLTLYSLFRWDQDPDFSVRSRLYHGTRLFIVPSEEWEFDYIREDELKAITKICDKMSKASAELCLNESDVLVLKSKVQELSKNKDKESADRYFVSVPFYRAVKDMLKNKCAKKDHLQRAEKKFAQLWEAIGFLEPERNAATIRSFNEQKEAFEVLLDWKREHGESK